MHPTYFALSFFGSKLQTIFSRFEGFLRSLFTWMFSLLYVHNITQRPRALKRVWPSCVLKQDTLPSQCVSPTQMPKWVPVNLMLGG